MCRNGSCGLEGRCTDNTGQTKYGYRMRIQGEGTHIWPEHMREIAECEFVRE